jgi:hypothetical protein
VGQGRDETEETVAKANAKATTTTVAGQLPVAVAAPRTELVTVKTEVLATLPILQQEVQELIVETPEQYAYADSLLGRVNASKRVWEPIWTRIYEKSIKPIREGLEELYQMNRDVEKPHTMLETLIKDKMKGYKLKELQRSQEADRQKKAEEQRLQREAEETQRRIEQAKTPQMRGKLAVQVQKIETQIQQVQEQPALEKVAGVSSTTRGKKVPRVTNVYLFCRGIAEGSIPVDCIEIKDSKLAAYYKEDPNTVAGWSELGVAIEDDIQIVGR